LRGFLNLAGWPQFCLRLLTGQEGVERAKMEAMSSVPVGIRPFSLDWLLAPVEAAAFFEKYWEDAPLLIGRDSPGYFADLPGIESVDELISATVSNRVRPETGERLIRAEPDGGLSERVVRIGTASVPDIQSVYRHYHDGYTVVINQLHRRSATVGRLCRTLQAELHHPVGANMYVTPASAQGFLPHVDTHDVFIVQLHGEKEWHVSEPQTQLPLARRRHGRQVLEAARTYTLEPGDTFYLPRGFAHEAVAADSPSMHLTIGVHVFRWSDLFAEALDLLADDEVDFRNALPPGFLDQPLDEKLITRLARTMAAALSDGSLAERAKARIGSRLVADDVVAERGRFLALGGLATLNEDSIVARSPEILCLVRTTEGSAMIEFAGNFVAGPSSINPALEYIALHERIKVDDLPGDLSPQDRIDLVARLVSEGLLEVLPRE
jgi:bifunctional lysine-specific demethylase and histidyl-hydroxylase NO66